jgi:hypothetical protein
LKDFHGVICKNAPALLILSDGSASKALVGTIYLQGKDIPFLKSTVVIPAESLNRRLHDLAVTIDLASSRKVSLMQSANAQIGMVITNTMDAVKLDDAKCEAKF